MDYYYNSSCSTYYCDTFVFYTVIYFAFLCNYQTDFVDLL